MSNLVLYRKYRPQRFEDVINQEHVKTTLQNAIINKRVGHAYLFTGPRGVGKTTMARILARALNCQNRTGAEPCNECEMCKQLLIGSSLDILEIDAASNTGVDNIRELIEHVQYAPSQASFKVIVIDEVHMLSKGAFNALLKTLEEPPAHVIFVLATTEVHKVPATIVSRTQRFDFKRVSVSDLSKLLEFVVSDNKLSIDQEALVAIAEAADGSFRDGLSLLDQIISYSSGKITLGLIEEVLGFTSKQALMQFMDLITSDKTALAVGFVSQLNYRGRDLFQFHKDFMEFLRKLLLAKISKETDAYPVLPLNRLVAIIEAFQKAGSELKWANIPSLPLELAVVELTQTDAGLTRNVAEDFSPPKNGSLKTSATDNETLQKVLDHWPQILEKVKDYNHSLISSMKLAEPVEVRAGELILLFPYKFHKDAIEARKNRIIIDQAIEEAVGVKIMAKPILKNEWKGAEPNAENQTLNSAIKILGGDI